MARVAAAVAVALAMVAGSVARAADPMSAPMSPEQSRHGAAADALERMARAAFGELAPAELKLVRGAPYREMRWTGPSSDPDDPSNNLAKAAAWGADRTIRASVLAWIVSDPVASKLVHPSGIGVAGARITGTIDLSYQTVTAPITILNCSIPDGIDLSYAHITSLDLRRSWTGAIDAEQAVIAGDVALRLGRYDDVNLYRAEIRGSLDCTSGHLIGDEPLSLVEARVGGDALFHQGFETGGVLDFRLAKVEQSLSFNDARFIGTNNNGLDAGRATIGGALYWVDIRLTPLTQLDLSDAHAGALWDDAASWPAPGKLMVNGFVYGDFSGGPSNAEQRLEWLNRQPKAMLAQPQPYRQLATVLREDGAEEGATRVEIAKETALTAYGGMPMSERIWRIALRITIGYGYRPLRALWWVLGFVSLGSVLFRRGYRARLITPTEEGAYEAFCRTGDPPPHYPPFSSFVYSLENFLPVVDLHQGTYWRPNPHHRPAGAGPACEAETGRKTLPAQMLRWYLWLHILAGWTITPLLFAGLAGLLRND
jgi:hypothetical protein